MIEGLATLVAILVILLSIALGVYVVFYGAPWVAQMSGHKLTEEELERAADAGESIRLELVRWMKLLGMIQVTPDHFRKAAQFRSGVPLREVRRGWPCLENLSRLQRGRRELEIACSEASDWLESSRQMMSEMLRNPLLAALKTEEIPDPDFDELRLWVKEKELPATWLDEFGVEKIGKEYQLKEHI